MNSTTKEILFFLLIWIMILLANLTSNLIYEKTNTMPFVTLVGVSLVSVLILYLVFKYSKIENFRLLEITPEKKCDGGSYLTGTNEYCKDKWNSPQGRRDLSRYNCINGHCGGTINYDGNTDKCAGQGMYNGRPLNLPSRTPQSNDKWENEMCQSPILTSPYKNVL